LELARYLQPEHVSLFCAHITKERLPVSKKRADVPLFCLPISKKREHKTKKRLLAQRDERAQPFVAQEKPSPDQHTDFALLKKYD